MISCKSILSLIKFSLVLSMYYQCLVEVSNRDTRITSWLLFSFIVTDALREKCPNTEFFLVRIFLHSDWIRRDTLYSVRIRENTDHKKPPYLDTFHAVKETTTLTEKSFNYQRKAISKGNILSEDTISY